MIGHSNYSEQAMSVDSQRPVVTIVGGGMITRIQLLPSIYHLQREGLVTSRQEGMYRRFYPADMQPPPILENGTTESQLRVLKAIQEMPGITQKELSKFLGLKQSTLSYQIDRLTAMGYITSEKQGRKVHYTAKHGAN